MEVQSQKDESYTFLHISAEASVLRHSAFFLVQLLYPYLSTGKTIVFTRQTFVGKVMSLLFKWSTLLKKKKKLA